MHLSFRKELAKFTEIEPRLDYGFPSVSKTFSSKMNEDEEDESVSADILNNSDFNKSGNRNSDTPF